MCGHRYGALSSRAEQVERVEDARTRPSFDLEAMQAHAGEAAQLLKVLANERRLQVLCMLAGGERFVGEINEALGLSQSALSQHLAVLRDEGLVQTRKDAQQVYYSLAPSPAAKVMETLHGIYCRGWVAHSRVPTVTD